MAVVVEISARLTPSYVTRWLRTHSMSEILKGSSAKDSTPIQLMRLQPDGCNRFPYMNIYFKIFTRVARWLYTRA